ncbi:MAG: hypothetical protein GY797_24830 [Deltaproteobacteria bacterium]|nr:hypothetical protein [Deltaproteobacteria bacterium]
MKKQTAANNEFLKRVKKTWNKPTFKKASVLVNNGQEKEARAYIQSFTKRPLDY